MKHPQSICLLNDSFPPLIDGVANTVVNYARNIEANGGCPVVVTPDVPGADDSTFSYSVLRYPSLDTRKLVGYVAGYPFSPDVIRRLKEENVQLLHSHCPFMSTVMARSLREQLNAPLVMTYHTKFDIDIAKAVRGKLIQGRAIHLLAKNISACDEVWVVSRGAGENLRSLGYEGEYIVMENGVDMPLGRVSDAEIAAATAEYDLPQGIPVYLFVGRMMWYKGLKIILDALLQLQEQGKDFRMVFIGGGRDEVEVQEYAQRLGSKCIFTGPVCDREVLRAWYCRADLFLFPSTYDTNGLVVREATACSLASVLVADSCAAEGVSDWQNGFLIQENADSMAAVLTELYEEPETVKRVGENAARDLYISWEQAVRKAQERYEVVIDRYRSGGYPARNKISDEFWNMQGILMDKLSKVENIGEEIGTHLQENRKELKQLGRDVKEDLKDIRDAVWQKLDDYL